MLRYDADELNEHAQRLHRYAGTAVVRYLLMGLLLGGYIGFTEGVRHHLAGNELLMLMGGNLLFYGVIGYIIGRHRAWSLERGAHEALCLREMELKLRRGEGDRAV